MKTQYVAFVDILGFAARLEQLDAENFAEVVDFWEKRILPRYPSPGYTLVTAYETFTRRFAEWQSVVALDKSRRGARFQVHSFLFSDSGFVASENILDIVDFCRYFLRSMILGNVPLRAGIGAGTFAALDIDTKRAASGDVLVRCPFAGSAVVRAYRAESSGLRGLRCFVHPSVVDGIPRNMLEHFIPLDAAELSASASHELDLFPPGMDEIEPGVNELLRCLADMERGVDPRYAEYYANTRAAIHRMTQRHDFL
jgi:hypothetical protein